MSEARHATPEGTAAFAPESTPWVADPPRGFDGLTLSSVGMGTYLGPSDTVTDRIYEAAIARALDLGCNVIDTAINYRCQRSERAIGRALAEGKVPREQVVVATKGGYIPYDGEPPSDPTTYFRQTFVASGLVDPQDLVSGSHCLAPRFLVHQIERSLANLNLACVDVYCLHNPETQLEEIPVDRFYERMRAAFETLEGRVEAGQIRCYGIATWNGLRASTGAAGLLSLERLVALARQLAGPPPLSRSPAPIQLGDARGIHAQEPIGAGCPHDAVRSRGGAQSVRRGQRGPLQNRLTQDSPGEIRTRVTGLDTDAQRAVQFARSTPGIGTALVGMKQVSHVEENLRVLTVPLLDPEDIDRLVPR
jgi:aryl-alcohol dehydrogenase-like predicted oxidoreductase